MTSWTARRAVNGKTAVASTQRLAFEPSEGYGYDANGNPHLTP
ncbi:hypothetical protein [Chitinimonas sp. BJB300]|nr:hypothetical protein [Chitinimonas sp. BJB300]